MSTGSANSHLLGFQLSQICHISCEICSSLNQRDRCLRWGQMGQMNKCLLNSFFFSCLLFFYLIWIFILFFFQKLIKFQVSRFFFHEYIKGYNNISIKVFNFSFNSSFFLLIFMGFFFSNRNLLTEYLYVNYFNQLLFTTCQWFCISLI